MRQAILITAYHDFSQLQQLVDYFDSDFELFIHIDRRCELPDLRSTHSNLHVFHRYRVPWGSVNHLHAILLLMREAHRYSDLEYFHLVTGSDYPVPAIHIFKTFCEEHRCNNYIEFFPLPRSSWDGEGGLERIRYRWLQPWLRPSPHGTAGYRLTINCVKLQRKLGLLRPFNYFDGKLFGGGTYWSMGREAISFAIDYLDAHPDYLRRFRQTKIAEEICLPTLWANSGLPLTNAPLRYINWGADGFAPRVLTEADHDRIVASGALFARKMQSGTSDRLIQMLKTQQ